jgi:hypothetical protein
MKRQSQLSPTLLIGLLLTLVMGLGQPTMLASSSGSKTGSPHPPGGELAAALSPSQSASLTAGVDADWWSAVQEEIARSEYHVTWQDSTYLADVPAAYQAPNRAHDLRTYFGSDGPIVIPRTGQEGGEAPAWRWEARLVAWGRAGALLPVPTASLVASDNRIDYERSTLREWYLNDEEGIEQGFALASPPPGEGAGGQLGLELALGGNLLAQVGEDGAGIEFREPGGELVLAYGGLRATDAQGQELPAQVKLNGSTLELLVDDSQASYPIEAVHTISGLPVVHDWWTYSLQAGAQLGTSVATAGDVNGDDYSDVIIGAPYYDGGQIDEGRVYVYYGSPTGLVSADPWIKEDNAAGARFGWSVSTAGDVNGDRISDIIIGEPRYSNGQTWEGGIWVYHGAPGGLSDSYASRKECNQVHAEFGSSVSTAGDVNGDGYSDIIVGAPLFDGILENEGWVWVFYGSPTGLGTEYWVGRSEIGGAKFGSSVATAGDLNADGYSDVIIGAPYTTLTSFEEGSVFVWHGSANGVNNGVVGGWDNKDWCFQFPHSAEGARAGFSVATAGDVNADGYSDVILSAPYYLSHGMQERGLVWLYLGSSTGLSDDYWDEASLLAGEGEYNNFGWSVGPAGDVNGDGYADILVGAPHYTDSNSHQGRAYLFYGNSSGVSDSHDWSATGNGVNAYLGTSVATAGDVNGDGYSDVLVGSPGYASLNGSVYAYHGGPDAPSETAQWTQASGQESAHFGVSVATAGDVNGDGYADLIVGAESWDGGQALEGGVWVYHGDAGGLHTTADWHKEVDQAEAAFGTSVGTAGDVNGDGYADVIVGAPLWTNGPGQLEEGGAWIYQGSSAGLISTHLWHKEPNHPGGQFGTSVGTAGDVNGDGYADVIVGAPYYDHPNTDEGLAWVYLGGDPEPDTVPHWDGEGDQDNAHYGYAVGTAGDVNGDGYSDIIVGAPDWNGAETNEGRAWVYHGSPGGVRDEYAWRQQGGSFNARYGFAVGTAGDVNGDGYADVIVGAPYWSGDYAAEGRVWAYHGSGAGLNSSSSWSKRAGQSLAHYGYSVGTAGDVNGDGYADAIIGIENWSGGEGSEGGASMYYGSAGGLESSRAWHAEGDQTSAHYGHSVGTAGDVNGDGYADIVVGAPQYTKDYSNEGQVFLYYGNGRPGVDMRLQQLSGTVPIPPLGWSSAMDRFFVTVRARTPYGRGRYRTQLEVRPLGILLSGVRYTYPWYDSGTGDNAPPSAAVNLMAGTRYHWRVRLCYHPSQTPYQEYSRWMHIPWNGWNEQDLRTAGYKVQLPIVLRNFEGD